jgi:hypothetical protein
MRGYPVRVRRQCTISDIQVNITTLSAGGNIQFALYASNPNTNAPTGAPLYSSSSVSTTLAGNIGCTGVGSVIEAGAVIWVFLNTDATAGVDLVTLIVALNNSSSFKSIVGTAAAFDTVSPNQNAQGAIKTQTFDTWPTLTGNYTADGFTDNEVANTPVFAFKV